MGSVLLLPLMPLLLLLILLLLLCLLRAWIGGPVESFCLIHKPQEVARSTRMYPCPSYVFWAAELFSTAVPTFCRDVFKTQPRLGPVHLCSDLFFCSPLAFWGWSFPEVCGGAIFMNIWVDAFLCMKTKTGKCTRESSTIKPPFSCRTLCQTLELFSV